MKLQLGPIDIRFRQGADDEQTWTNLELAFVTNRNGGMARRETALRAGFRSDHLVDLVGTENPADTFECPESGTLYFGKIVQAPTGTYVISAKEVYTRALYEKACKRGLQQAEAATSQLQPQPAA